jgi:hypothetical protein
MKCDVLVILYKNTNNFFHILDIPSIRKSNMLSVIRNKTCICCIIVVTAGILFTFYIQNVIRMKESLALQSFFLGQDSILFKTLSKICGKLCRKYIFQPDLLIRETQWWIHQYMNCYSTLILSVFVTKFLFSDRYISQVPKCRKIRCWLMESS